MSRIAAYHLFKFKKGMIRRFNGAIRRFGAFDLQKKTMKAIGCSKPGGPEVMFVKDYPIPVNI